MIIALDIGGVCLSIHPERCFGMFGYRSIQEVPQQILYGLERYERGIIDEKEFLAIFRANTEAALSDEFIIKAWNSILGAQMDGMEELVQELKANGHQIVLFSDTSKLHIESFRRDYPISKHLPEAIYSFVVGAKKPEPAMFAAFEADYGKPDLYIDDRSVCLEGGEMASWTCHQFKGVEDLRIKLNELAFL